MVQDLHGGDDTNASFYAGLLISAYAVAEAMTAMMWGTLSDRYGRKPIVLFGLVGVALSSLIFGLAQKYWVALLARFIGGALNGNVAVMQTMVAEMVRNPAHEPKAYAVQPFVWILGSIIGSAQGGFLAQPAVFYPSIFPKDGLFGRYPYLLPNLVSVAAVAIAVIQGMLFLEETNPRFSRSTHPETKPATNEMAAETSPLLDATSHPRPVMESIQQSVPTPVFLEEGLPTAVDQKFDLRRSSFGTMHSIRVPHDQLLAGTSNEQPTLESLPREEGALPSQRTFNTSVVMLTVALVLMAFHQMAFAAILPIHLLDAPAGGRLDLYGGFGFTVHDVGAYMAVNGVIALLVQAIIFPVFVEHLGVWYSFVVTILLYPVAYVVMPFLTALRGSEPAWILPMGIYLSLFLQAVFAIVPGPCILILLKNATPSPLVLGKVNGFAMSATCASRTISPPLIGIIYSQGGSAAAWFSCAAIAMIGGAQLWWVPREAASVSRVEVENPFKAVGSAETQRSQPVIEENAIVDDDE